MLDWDEYLSGMVAADISTSHGGLWNTIRSSYIFYAYNKNGSGLLTIAEFYDFTKAVHLAARITDEDAMTAQLNEWLRAFNIPPGTEVLTIEDFTTATGNMTIRGTSRLLRFEKETSLPKGMVDLKHAQPPPLPLVTSNHPGGGGGGGGANRGGGGPPYDVKWGSDGILFLERLNIKERSHHNHIPTTVAAKQIEKRIPGLPTHMKTDSGSGFSLHNTILHKLVVPDSWIAGAVPLGNGFDAFPFSYIDILSLCEAARTLLSAEPSVIEVKLPVSAPLNITDL